jgi:hypothetical protein
MVMKQSIALGILCTLGLGAAASADVVQTTVGVQQSEQYQSAVGGGDVSQNAANVQQLDQRSVARDRGLWGYRVPANVQQTTAGVQTNVQGQEALGGGRVRQNTVDVSDLIQRNFGR